MLANFEKKIFVPSHIVLDLQKCAISISGKLGTVLYNIPKFIFFSYNDNILFLSYSSRNKSFKSILNSVSINIRNAFNGVDLGYQKRIIILGIGYKVKSEKNFLEFYLGFSHTVRFEIPKGISITLLNSTEFVIKGVCKQYVGQIAANIRAIRPPDSYKGKGIRYFGEECKLKVIKKK